MTKKRFPLLLLLLASTVAFSQSTLVSGSHSLAFVNDATTGTVQYYLATGNGTASTTVVVSKPTDALSAVVGICDTNCGTAGVAYVANYGIQKCVFDNATIANDTVTIGVGGACHDTGSKTAAGIAIVQSTNAVAGTYQVIWTGASVGSSNSNYILPSTVVQTNQNNTYSGTVQDYSGASEVKVPAPVNGLDAVNKSYADTKAGQGTCNTGFMTGVGATGPSCSPVTSGTSTTSTSNASTYVATFYASPSGSGTTCSQTVPCSLNYAMNTKVTAGQVVQAATGTYSFGGTNFQINNSGTSGNQLVLTCATWGQCLIQSTVTGNTAVLMLSGNYITLDGFDVSSNSGAIPNASMGLFVSGTGSVITHNNIHGIQADCAGTTYANTGNIGGGGIQLYQTSGNTLIDSNHIHNINDQVPACASATGGQGGVYARWYDGILAENGASGATDTITNNIVDHVFGGWGINMGAAGTVANNLLFSNGNGGLVVVTGSSIESNVNNIIVNNGLAATTFGGIYYLGGSPPLIAADVTTASNVISGNTGGVSSVYGVTGTPILTNTLSTPASSIFINWQPDGTGNYQETSTSPTIDAGTSTAATNHDAIGTSRPLGTAYDIGPYEYGVVTSGGVTNPTSGSSGTQYPNVQQIIANWANCGATTTTCAGGTNNPTAYSGPVADQTYQLDQQAVKFSITGPSANQLWYDKLGANNTATNFSWDHYVYLPSLTGAQSAEYDMFQFVSLYNYMIGTQCNYANGTWDIWNGNGPSGTSAWVHTTIPCTSITFAAGTWHHLNLQATTNTTAHSYTYTSLAIDGTVNTLGQTYNAKLMTAPWGDNSGVQYQLDTTSGAGTVTEWVDESNFTVASSSGGTATTSVINAIAGQAIAPNSISMGTWATQVGTVSLAIAQLPGNAGCAAYIAGFTNPPSTYCTPYTGEWMQVNNAANSADCSLGGGTSVHGCVYQAGAWGPVVTVGPSGTNGSNGTNGTPTVVLSLSYTAGSITTYAAGSNTNTTGTITATHSTATTLVPTGMIQGAWYDLEILQDSTGGGNTFTLGTTGGCPSWYQLGIGTVTSLSLSTTALAINELSWKYDGTRCVLNFH